MTTALLAIDDGLVHGELNIADLLFLVAAIIFGVVTFINLAEKATQSALMSLGLCLVAAALFVL